MPRRGFTATLVALAAVLPIDSLGAQEHRHDGDASAGHHDRLHFSHPMFTESVSPDTKIRTDFLQTWATDENESEFGVEAEYSPHPAFSVVTEIPYAVVSAEGEPSTSRLGSVEIGVKFANFAFEEQGVLLGYGLAVGLPTGEDSVGIGSNHIWEFSPFLNLGFKRGAIELVGYTVFGIPTNQNEGEEVETELKYDVSALYHVSRRLQGLVELNGETVLSGEEAGAGVVSISPSVKVAPLATPALLVGLGGSFPLGDDERDARLRVSVFYHF
jgi:hypothetical protein